MFNRKIVILMLIFGYFPKHPLGISEAPCVEGYPFKGKGNNGEYYIDNLREPQFKEAIDLVYDQFLPPLGMLFSFIVFGNFSNDTIIVTGLISLLQKNLSLACFDRESGKIVGVAVLDLIKQVNIFKSILPTFTTNCKLQFVVSLIVRDPCLIF